MTEPRPTEPTASEPTASQPAASQPADDATAPQQPPPVEEQREELAETVSALAQKLDVPTRVKTAASDTVHTAEVKAKDNPQMVAIAGVVGLTVIGAILVVRRRTRRRG